MRRNTAVYIIAEAGVNHNGSVSLAKKLVDVAQKAGADAVKFQSFSADNLATAETPQAAYQKKNRAYGSSQLEMLRRLELDENAHRQLYSYCHKRGLEFLSTPFDTENLERLIKIGIRKLKISSGEITNGPLLFSAAQTGLPIILSTGMSDLDEIQAALGVLAFGYVARSSRRISMKAFTRAFRSRAGQAALRSNVTLLHCTSEYPAPMSDVNLLAMDTLSDHFGVRVGLSDHTQGISASIAAAARGAAVIEKHFTLDRSLPGPDHKASLEPDELAELVRAVRDVEKALGDGRKRAAPSEIKNIPFARRSLVAAVPIKKGDLFSRCNLAAKRAGKGLSPMRYWDLLGRVSTRNYSKDQKVMI